MFIIRHYLTESHINVIALLGTYHGAHFQFLDRRERNFANMAQSEVGHVHDVSIGYTAILRKPHISDHEDQFENVKEIVLCSIMV
jgi:hypothetical protein